MPWSSGAYIELVSLVSLLIKNSRKLHSERYYMALSLGYLIETELQYFYNSTVHRWKTSEQASEVTTSAMAWIIRWVIVRIQNALMYLH